MINFNHTGQYNGYVIDEAINNVNPDNIDYSPYGGFTAHWGFDCLHANDISLNPMMNMTSFDPELLKLPFSLKVPKGFWKNNKGSFKTKDFVKNELDKLTSSILRYLLTNVKIEKVGDN